MEFAHALINSTFVSQFFLPIDVLQVLLPQSMTLFPFTTRHLQIAQVSEHVCLLKITELTELKITVMELHSKSLDTQFSAKFRLVSPTLGFGK